ncbi:MAG: 3'-5' exonuclease [Bacteroidetes bacterium]|nr:MAG: 3'-5' exonuclease [Bacteroidota bacterium]
MSPIPLHNILFLDIETVPQYADFSLVPEEWKELWARKSAYFIKDKETDSPHSVYPNAGIYAEFGKIICISCGVISTLQEEKRFLIKSFYGDDEKTILQQFCEMLGKWGTGTDKYLCAHNGREFDFPYLCRRLLIHELCVPSILFSHSRKKWELPHLDTMELWKFGDYKNYTSLNLLALTLGIPTPKDDIDGSMVNAVYWQQQDLQRIVLYCQKDVFTVAQVYLRLYGESLIRPGNIDIK